ncbi:hypothetical protein DB41_EC00110 [Neochlamydia sp. TUME1]|uniref:hypothetical protein n=1 Tax=Neochlamydia sp. TUME1 TaxID=1478174 RepID=UPI00057E8D22|nr:hypothetical protein [Neochlamydia sp. TUME1]KIC76863.1 hypothetical protein DB41_EC00110 [Neochlamydia sp. TUME1]
MTKAELIKKIAVLESVNDQIYSELYEVDRLMRLVGFEGGLETVKLTAQEIYQSGHVGEEGEENL